MHIKKLKEIETAEDQGQLIAITMEEGMAHIFVVTPQ